MLTLNSYLTGHMYFVWHPYPAVEDNSRRGVAETALYNGDITVLEYSVSEQLPWDFLKKRGITLSYCQTS